MMMTFARRSHTFWIGLFLLVFGGIFLAIGWSLIRQAEQYQREGRQSTGVVLTKAIERATRTGSNQRSETKYTVTYRFTAEDGRSFEGRQGVSVATWDRLREKEPIQIEYVASNPATSRVAGESSATLEYIFAAIGFVAAFIGALVFARSLNAAKARARIWTQGTQADATVAAVEETNFRVNRRPMWVVRYQYRDHSGQTHDGTSDYLAAEKAHAWKAGDRIRVRFDPQKPGMSVWRE
jgi:uncharacterized protein DUF3592